MLFRLLPILVMAAAALYLFRRYLGLSRSQPRGSDDATLVLPFCGKCESQRHVIEFRQPGSSYQWYCQRCGEFF